MTELVLAATGLLLIVNLICQYRADSIKEQTAAIQSEALCKRIDAAGERTIMYVAVAETELTVFLQLATQLSAFNADLHDAATRATMFGTNTTVDITSATFVAKAMSQLPKRIDVVNEYTAMVNKSATEEMALRSQASTLAHKANQWSFAARLALYSALLMNAIAITLSWGIYKLYKT